MPLPVCLVALKRISVDMIDAKARDKCLKEVVNSFIYFLFLQFHYYSLAV